MKEPMFTYTITLTAAERTLVLHAMSEALRRERIKSEDKGITSDKEYKLMELWDLILYTPKSN